MERGRSKALIMVGIVLVALSMRMPITAAGSLTEVIQGNLRISGAAAGGLTTVTLVAFGFTSFLVGEIGARVGISRTMAAGMLLLVLGGLIRVSGGYGAFMLGSVLLASGISAANVLLPALVRLKFPLRVGMMTSLYLAFMGIAAATGAGVALPLSAEAGLSWQRILLLVLVPPVLATAIWFFLGRDAMVPRLAAGQDRLSLTQLLRRPLVWFLSGYMGLQSLMYYSFVAWLPAMLTAQGFSSGVVGLTVFAFQGINMLASFGAPMLVAPMKDQRWAGFATGFFYIIGMIGLHSEPGPVLLALSILFMGLGAGSTVALAMLFFNLRTGDSVTAGRVSGLAQSSGYLLAAIGPVLIGGLHDGLGTWSGPLVVLMFFALSCAVCGWLSGRPRLIQ